MELYVERGFENTTVAEIAERAGLTERTFFRHFADKREVLFAGAGTLREFLVSAVTGAPESAAPIEAVAAALEAAGAVLGSFGLAAFGLVIWLMIVQSPASALVLAAASWLAVAVLGWQVRRWL